MIIATVIGIFAIAAPIVFTLYQAQKLGMDAESAHALAYAQDVLRRSENTASQITAGFERLLESGYAPCSDQQIELMRQIDLSSSYIQTIGYTEKNRLMCSSLGRHGEGLPLGPIDARSAKGASTRANVSFDFAPGTNFIVTERDGYAAIIHKELPIDATTGRADTNLAVFSRVNDMILSSRGNIKTNWIETTRDQNSVAFRDGEYIVAVVRSERYFIGAVAAIPVAYLMKEVRATCMRLVPIGLIGGIILALAVMYLARQQLALPAVIRGALRRNEFFLLYQPVVDLRTGRWVGAEALIRWRRSNGEMIRPDLFIKAAEEAGIIQRITQRVLEIVERDAWDLFRRYPHFHLGINLSPQDLHDKSTVQFVQGLARRLKVEPRSLMVEATERGFIKPDIAREVVKQMRADGISVAIDDFGTGYSSLSYLETFELDYLKIDKSFVDTIGSDAATSQVIPHIIEMAKALGLEMIAEGVETEEQAQYLRDHGVEFAQGWFGIFRMKIARLF